MTTWFKPANFFFLAFRYARVLVNQFLFYFPSFPPHFYICTTQPELNQAWRTPFMIFLICFWC